MGLPTAVMRTILLRRSNIVNLDGPKFPVDRLVTKTFVMSLALGKKEVHHLSDHVDLSVIYRSPWRCWDRSALSCNPKLTLQLLCDDIVHKRFPNLVGEWDVGKITRKGHNSIKRLDLVDLGLLSEEEAYRQTRVDLASVAEIEAWLQSGRWLKTHDWLHFSSSLPIEQVVEAGRRGYPVDRRFISGHQDITLEIVDSGIGVNQWDWHRLTVSISPTEILANLDRPWDQWMFLCNRRITWKLVTVWILEKKIPILGRYYLGEIAKRISVDELVKIPRWRSLPWNLYVLSGNNEIPTRWLLANVYRCQEDGFDNSVGTPNYHELSSRATLEDYLDFPSRRWKLTSILQRSTMRDLYRTWLSHGRRWKKRHLVLVHDFDPTDLHDYRHWCPMEKIYRVVDAWSDILFV